MSSLNWQDGMKDWGATEEAAEGVQKGKPGMWKGREYNTNISIHVAFRTVHMHSQLESGMGSSRAGIGNIHFSYFRSDFTELKYLAILLN